VSDEDRFGMNPMALDGSSPSNLCAAAQELDIPGRPNRSGEELVVGLAERRLAS